MAGGVFERAPEEGLAAATDQHQMRHLSAQILALDRREVGGRRGEQRTKPLHPIEITREAVRHRHRHRAEHAHHLRSEEHTSELQSLMRNSYAVFCLKKKTNTNNTAN